MQRSNNPVFVFGSLLTQHQFTEQNFAIGRLNRPDFLTNFQSIVTADQTLWDNRATRNQIKLAETARAISAEDERREKLNAAVRVVQAYFGAAMAEAGMTAARGAVKSAQADLERAESVRNAGMSTDADVLSIRVHLASVRDQEIRRAADLEVARAALNESLGLPLDTPHTLTTPLEKIESGQPAGGTIRVRCRQPPPRTAAGEAGCIDRGHAGFTRTQLSVAASRRARGIRSRPAGFCEQGRHQLVVRRHGSLESLQRVCRPRAHQRNVVRRGVGSSATTQGGLRRAPRSSPRLGQSDVSRRTDPAHQRDRHASRRELAHHQEPVRSRDVHGDGPAAHRNRAPRCQDPPLGRNLRTTAGSGRTRTRCGNSVCELGGIEMRRSTLAWTAPALMLLAGCGKEPPPKTEAASLTTFFVKTVAVEPIEWPTTYEAVGTVRARTTTQIAARMMGYVREMKVNLGDRVASGQLLAVLDSRDLEAGLHQADAGVYEAKSAIPEADSGIAAARANLDLAEVTFKRMTTLHDQRSISNQEFDEASSRLKLAQAGYEMAAAKRKQLDARIRQAESGQTAAGVTRGYAELRAPFAGVVVEKRANLGDMASPGMPLLTLEQAGAYQLEVPVEEARMGIVRAGQPVSILLDAFDQSIAARVTEIGPTVDPGSRTFLAKILLPSSGRIHSGLFGRARFVLGSRKTLAVPSAAVMEIGQVRNVLVAENQVARARLVSLGETRDGLVEVLSGLSSGDRIITPRPSNVSDGSRIGVR